MFVLLHWSKLCFPHERIRVVVNAGERWIHRQSFTVYCISGVDRSLSPTLSLGVVNVAQVCFLRTKTAGFEIVYSR